MGVLTKNEIVDRIRNFDLIRGPKLDASGNPEVEGASYDLCVGTIVWKDSESRDTKILHYNPAKALEEQEHTTLQPGQMLLVVTKEELNMPMDLSATVFSRNKIAREGILALNAGHVDPGYQGSIIIRLINLRAIPYTLFLGVPIYTIVFQTLEQPISLADKHARVSRNESIGKAVNSVNEALANALYDLALLDAFVKKGDIDEMISKSITSLIKNRLLKVALTFTKILAWILAALVTLTTIAGGWKPLMDGLELIIKKNKS